MSGVETARLAPTHKISDDARWDKPVSSTPAVAPGGAAYQSLPPQMPAPRTSAPNVAATPSGGAKVVQPVATVAPAAVVPLPLVSAPLPKTPPPVVVQAAPVGSPLPGTPRPATPIPSPAGSVGQSEVALPRRGKGLIIAVLVIDIGLAAAGAFLLLQGLSHR